jgi:hypothetical protein
MIKICLSIVMFFSLLFAKKAYNLIWICPYHKGEFYMQVMNKDRRGKHLKKNQLNTAKRQGKKIVNNKIVKKAQ